MSRISRALLGAVLASVCGVNAGAQDLVKPPRGGLFGAAYTVATSTTTGSFYAINPADTDDPGDGTLIDSLTSPLTALAKEPSTGIVYGFSHINDGPVRMFTVNQRTGELTGAATVEFLGSPVNAVLGADFSVDGTLYVTVQVKNPTSRAFRSYLATLGEPAGGKVVASSISEVLANAVTALSVDPDSGNLWAATARYDKRKPNTLIRYNLASSLQTDFPIAQATGLAGGIGSLQWTCDGSLYGGALQAHVITITATPVPGHDYSGFTIVYRDLDDNLIFDFDVDQLISFSGLTQQATKGKTLTWSLLTGVPAIAGISTASGVSGAGLWSFLDNSKTKPSTISLASSLWTYGTPAIATTDGGAVFTLDLSATPAGVVLLGTGTAGGEGLGGFAPATSCGVTELSGAPIPRGSEVTEVSTQYIESIIDYNDNDGFLSMDICVVGPDPRVRAKPDGTVQFQPGYLDLAEVPHIEGIGDCSFLDDASFIVAPWYQFFNARLADSPAGTPFAPMAVIANFQAVGVQAIGGIATQYFLDDLLEFEGGNPLDQCALARPLSLGSTSAELGDLYPNVEGEFGINDTIQCNGLTELKRRSAHVVPVKLVGTSSNEENLNIRRHFNGIKDTLLELAKTSCLAGSLSQLQSDGDIAENAFTQGRFEESVLTLESLARTTQNADLTGCPAEANYPGNLISRYLATAFSVYDRHLIGFAGPWQIYRLPRDLDLPLVSTRPAGTAPVPCPAPGTDPYDVTDADYLACSAP